MRVKRDTITGLAGLTWSVIWLILIQMQTTQPANLLEPGPRLLPYIGLIVVFLSSLMLAIKGLRDWKKDPTSEEPYFPEGGKLKVARSYLMLVVTGVLMGIFGFLVIAPFSIFQSSGRLYFGNSRTLCNVCLRFQSKTTGRNTV